MKSLRIIDRRFCPFFLTGALLGVVFLAGLMAGCASTGRDAVKGKVGLQLYSLRTQLGKDVPDTLAEAQGWGIKYVELAGTYKMTPAEFKAQLDAHQLVPISGHYSYERWRDNPEGVLAEADLFGLKYVGCAWIPHEGNFDEATCRKAIDVFNRATALAAQHHMTFFYHTHGYEFQPYENGTLFDLMMRELSPEMKLEMDIFWIVHAGQDPVKMMEKYPDRFELLHLKDMKKGTKTGLLTGHTDVNNDVAFGTGQIDLPAILREAGKIGVKWYFIEDESTNSEKQIPQSLSYLGAAP